MASSTRRLDQLAASVSSSAAILGEYLESRNLPQPSVNVGGLAGYSGLPPDISTARRSLQESVLELAYLASGPQEYMIRYTTEYVGITALRWIYHFRIFEHVPLDGVVSYKELAKLAGQDERTLKRIVRRAILNRFFIEPRPGYIAHTSSTALLLKDSDVRDMVGLMIEEGFDSSTRYSEAYEKWGPSNSATETAFQLAFQTDLKYFDWLEQRPENLRRFGGMMKAHGTNESYSSENFVKVFNWSLIGEGKVVDIGGGLGHMSIAIAKEFPNIKFVVQDFPDTAKQGAERCSEELRDRISFEGYDFFNPQPVEGADIYMLKAVLHDHPDPDVEKIIRNTVTAMRPGSRILIIDGVLPEPGAMHPVEERAVRSLDLQMGMFFNAGERDPEQWCSVIANSDPRLKVKSINRVPGNVSSGIEVVFEP
ncbi:S-adenosyl-L-methionine-dependent methyltransferase [Patellaria atrata CBS 101060]|uniref:S-adenosyl-L-methionine-dependent methyltransferase n=1 Tax=Patellaria atrata CBS 101060 TaxID=1346257 RepID=A0A9P4VS72_9PEZI|nr:S-adenosyl-L-methionine-dependent methyltransferase [Patellaria atrata CBS 101060]